MAIFASRLSGEMVILLASMLSGGVVVLPFRLPGGVGILDCRLGGGIPGSQAFCTESLGLEKDWSWGQGSAMALS